MTHPTVPLAIALTGWAVFSSACGCDTRKPSSRRHSPRTTRTIVVAWVRSAVAGGGDGGPQSSVLKSTVFGRRTGPNSRTGDYSEIGPVLSPNLSVGTSSLSSIATSRLAIGVFFG